MTINYYTICYGVWGGLGFVRGIQSYTYYTNNTKKKQMYIDKITNGFIGAFMYVFPILIPFTLYKEVYRLEVNLRNLEDHKKSYFYNQLIGKEVIFTIN